MARIVKDSKDKLIKDFHSVISDTEELMKSVSNESGGTAQALRTKIEENLKQAKEYLEDFEDSVIDRSRPQHGQLMNTFMKMPGRPSD